MNEQDCLFDDVPTPTVRIRRRRSGPAQWKRATHHGLCEDCIDIINASPGRWGPAGLPGAWWRISSSGWAVLLCQPHALASGLGEKFS